MVMTTGAKKKIDIVSASCSVSSARKLNRVEPNRKMPRTICLGRLVTRYMPRLFQPRNSTSTSSRWTRNRVHETNTASTPESTRYLALTSRIEKRNPALITRRIAAPGVACSVLPAAVNVSAAQACRSAP